MANISNSAGNSSPEGAEEGGFDAFIDVPLLTMCVLIFATNGLVVGLFSCKKSLRTPSNVFLASLAVSDGVSSVLGIPLLIACSATESEGACVPTAVFLRFSAVCAMLHLTVIAFDRYGFIAHPMKYPPHMCHRAAALALCLLYLASLAVALAQFSWLDLSTLDVTQDADERVIAIEKRYFLFCFVAFFCVPVLLTSFCYGSILLITLRHNRAILRQRRHSQRGVRKALGRCRGSFVLWAMFFIFTICLLSNFILGLQHHMGDELFGEFPPWLENAVVFLRFTPPLSNPVLCTFFKQDFKSALRTWWKKFTTNIFGSCLSRRAEKQNRSVAYSSAPRSSRAVSLLDTCSEYCGSRSTRETGNLQESTSTPVQPNRFLGFPEAGSLMKHSIFEETT